MATLNSNIIKFTGATMADMASEFVLDGAKNCDYEHVLVIGIGKDGLSHLHGTSADMAAATYLLTMAIHWIHSTSGRIP